MKSRRRRCDTVRSSEVVFQEDFPNDIPDFNREALAEAGWEQVRASGSLVLHPMWHFLIGVLQ